jgi:hypothetical protein
MPPGARSTVAWATTSSEPRGGTGAGLTRCGLVVGPDEILGLHHNHGETLSRRQVAEGQQDLPYCVGGLGEQVWLRGLLPQSSAERSE